MSSKIEKALSCSQEEVHEALLEVFRFLELVALSGEKLTPSSRVDLVWHEWILFTKSYAQFCQEHFGRFIHHTPGGDEKENRENFRKTLHLYIRYYGPPPSKYWGDSSLTFNHGECVNCEGVYEIQGNS